MTPERSSNLCVTRAVCLTLLWLGNAHANDAAHSPAAEATRPVVAKPAVAPEAGALSPLKVKAAGEKAASSPVAQMAPKAGPALEEKAEVKPAAKADDALRTMLEKRLAGSGEVVLKTSEAAPQPVNPAPRKRRAAIEVAGHAATAKAAHEAAEHPPHWSYGGAGGPEQWSKLDPEFSKCATGSRQSPIDIRDGVKVQLDPIQFDYQLGGFRVLDNGHTIQVNVAAGNSIEVLGRRYDLVQFHFHKPAEERINGRQFDMVAHLVHKDLEGRLAVVAVLLSRGTPQPVIQAVWNNLPLERGEDIAASVAIDLNKLLPEDRRYLTYMGSLTTPPCSEGVLWMVMKSPVQMSAEQIAIFSHLYPMNARPVQPASGRLIKESN